MADADYGHLVVGRRYRVAKPFVDFDRGEHRFGESWTFVAHEYLPHDDGHTFRIRYDDGSESSFRMSGAPEDQGAILQALEQHVVPV